MPLSLSIVWRNNLFLEPSLRTPKIPQSYFSLSLVESLPMDSPSELN
jgi:hypothetical protein